MKFSVSLIPLLIVLSGVTQAAQVGFVATDRNSFDAAAAKLHNQLSAGSYPLVASNDRQSIEADLQQMQ